MNWESIDEVIHECMKAQLLVHEDWEDYLTFKRKMYHMKNTKMRDVLADEELHGYILSYRRFLLKEMGKGRLPVFEDMPGVSFRIKTQNSLEYKIRKYGSGMKERGAVPLANCVNDLYGMRIILDEEAVTYDELKAHIVPLGLKCIDSSNGDYKAVHVYISNPDYEWRSYVFRWELQIWLRRDAAGNYISHTRDKEYYTVWEQDVLEREGKA
ncbi:MAG: hypothetical protein LUE27_07735 [Clostridia bacterium]|nr:hypothetical protein [Clostridia bacterium]